MKTLFLSLALTLAMPSAFAQQAPTPTPDVTLPGPTVDQLSAYLSKNAVIVFDDSGTPTRFVAADPIAMFLRTAIAAARNKAAQAAAPSPSPSPTPAPMAPAAPATPTPPK
jgi:hypothetical protein